ncbi:hypothetical protein BDQ17DRAFT_1379203 [Cyathus striatus]|nr:hypothetical protein BDQ17DRAFT_1379203 [Cyathus striatus]
MRFSLRRLSLIGRLGTSSTYTEMSSSTHTLTQTPPSNRPNKKIITHLRRSSRSSLLPLLQTCKSLHTETETILYSTMADSHPEAHFRFLTSITKNPRLAALVLHYGMYERHVGIPFLKLLNRGLKLMINLREISFREHFSYGRIDTRDDTSKSAIVAFLKNQGSLEHLYTKWYRGWGVPDSNLCSGLISLRGDLDTIVAWAPGRSIRSLYWETGNGEVPLDRVNTLEKTLNSIRTLSFGDHTHNSTQPLLASIVKHLESLDTIELIRRPLDELEHLPQIPNLHRIIITSPAHITDPFFFVNRLFAQIPQLETVDIHVNNPTYDNLDKLFCYRSWDRTCTRREMCHILPHPIRDQRICKYPEWLLWT